MHTKTHAHAHNHAEHDRASSTCTQAPAPAFMGAHSRKHTPARALAHLDHNQQRPHRSQTQIWDKRTFTRANAIFFFFFFFVFSHRLRKLCSANKAALIYFSSSTLSDPALQPSIFHMKANVWRGHVNVCVSTEQSKRRHGASRRAWRYRGRPLRLELQPLPAEHLV